MLSIILKQPLSLYSPTQHIISLSNTIPPSTVALQTSLMVASTWTDHVSLPASQDSHILMLSPATLTLWGHMSHSTPLSMNKLFTLSLLTVQGLVTTLDSSLNVNCWVPVSPNDTKLSWKLLGMEVKFCKLHGRNGTHLQWRAWSANEMVRPAVFSTHQEDLSCPHQQSSWRPDNVMVSSSGVLCVARDDWEGSFKQSGQVSMDQH